MTELLIVIAIIAILASLMLPALNNAREKSKATQCVNNKKQAMMAQIQYSGDYNNYYIITMQHPTIPPTGCGPPSSATSRMLPERFP